MKNSILANAIELAVIHHSRQRRMNKVDYIVHPAKVALYVRRKLEDLSDANIMTVCGATREEIEAASWTHDTVEDTRIPVQELLEKTSSKVLELVMEVTSNPDEIEKIGKAEYLIQKMNSMSPGAFLIKLCDRYENVSGLCLVRKEFGERYSKETKKILSGIKIPETGFNDFQSIYIELIQLINGELEAFESQKERTENESVNA